MTTRAETSNRSPVSSSVSRADEPVASSARTRSGSGAVLGRGAGDGDHQPRVVDELAVVGRATHRQGRRGAGSASWPPSSAPMRRERGSTDDLVPAGRAARRRPRTRAHQRRFAHPVSGQQRDQLRHGVHEVGALRVIRIPRSTALRRRCRRCRWRGSAAPCTSFELQRLVPNARSCFSTSTAVSPRLAASSAMPAPVIPPPMTSTSTSPPPATAARSAVAAGGVEGGQVSHQPGIRSVRG